MTSLEALGAFESIATLTGEMCKAARAGEWDKLALLEARCAAVVAALQAASPIQFPPHLQRRKAKLIQKIMADDAEAIIPSCFIPLRVSLVDASTGSVTAPLRMRLPLATLTTLARPRVMRHAGGGVRLAPDDNDRLYGCCLSFTPHIYFKLPKFETAHLKPWCQKELGENPTQQFYRRGAPCSPS